MTYDATQYWNDRARRLGLRAVANLKLDDRGYERETNRMWERLEPVIHSAFSKGSRILDFGCGNGRWSRRMAEMGLGYEITAVDPSVEMRRLAAANNSHSAVRYLSEIPAGHVFDGLFCFTVLLHVPPEAFATVVSSLHQSIKPCGSVVLAEAVWDSAWQNDHCFIRHSNTYRKTFGVEPILVLDKEPKAILVLFAGARGSISMP